MKAKEFLKKKKHLESGYSSTEYIARMMQEFSDQENARLTAINEKQAEQSKKLKRYVDLLKDAFDLLNGNGLIVSSRSKKVYTQFTNYVNNGSELNKEIEALESELQSLQAGEKEEKPLTKEEAQKCYPDLCFCEHSTYTKGVCDKCNKSQD